MPRVLCPRCDCLSHNKDGTCGASQITLRRGKCDGYMNAHNGMRQQTPANVDKKHGVYVMTSHVTLK